MIENPAERAALQHVVRLSAEIELQLSKAAGGGPVLELLKKARSQAVSGIAALIVIDPEDAAAIRTAQNEITCFRLIVAWLKEIVVEGYEAGSELDDDDHEDLADALGLTPDQTDDARRAGFPPAE